MSTPLEGHARGGAFDEGSHPLDAAIRTHPRDPPTPDGLSGPRIDEASRGLAGDGSSNNVLTVEVGTYPFTFRAPLNAAAAHYTIVKP
jgi:hypothetical protein